MSKCFIFVFICSHKSLRTSGNKLVINLAFSNILMHTKSWIIIINGFAGGPVLGKWGCVSFGGFGTLAGLTEIWTITCIAYERHRAISTPLTKARKLSSFQVCKQLNILVHLTSFMHTQCFDTYKESFWVQNCILHSYMAETKRPLGKYFITVQIPRDTQEVY